MLAGALEGAVRLHRLQNALLLQQFLFSLGAECFCGRGKEKSEGKRPIFFLKADPMENLQSALLNTPGLALVSALHDYILC